MLSEVQWRLETLHVLLSPFTWEEQEETEEVSPIQLQGFFCNLESTIIFIPSPTINNFGCQKNHYNIYIYTRRNYKLIMSYCFVVYPCVSPHYTSHLWTSIWKWCGGLGFRLVWKIPQKNKMSIYVNHQSWISWWCSYRFPLAKSWCHGGGSGLSGPTCRQLQDLQDLGRRDFWDVSITTRAHDHRPFIKD